MGADELYHFPTPTEAFGVRPPNNHKTRQPNQQNRQTSFEEDLPPLHPNQSTGQHPRLATPTSGRQVPQQRIPSNQAPRPHPQQLQRPSPQIPQQQQHFPIQQNIPPGIRVNSRSSSQAGDVQPQNPNYSGYAPSAYGQLPQPQQPQLQQRVDPSKVLERQLRDLFDRVDRDRDGRLTEDELATALLNNDGTRFQQSTVRLMIKLFDTDASGTIEFREFYHLWNYILHWRKTFQRFDTNQNLKISFGEYQAALESFGYRLPTDIVLFIFQKFGDFNANKPMSLRFDKFVESLVWLLRCTNIFKKYDSQGNGIATIPFQDFVHEIITFI